MFFRNPFFYRTLLFILLAELISFFAYLLPQFQTIAFFIIAACVLGVTLLRFEYGVFVLLVELFIGSKGFLFFWDADGTLVSVRLALWLIVLAVWCAQSFAQWIRTRVIPFSFDRRLVFLYGTLGIVVVFAFLNGYVRGNSFHNLFFDANAWLYFLLLFPFMQVFQDEKNREHLVTLLIASVFWTSLKALLLLSLYTHDPLHALFLPAYRWVRQTGVGELTILSPTFLRVFFQSQIYTVIAFFMLLASFFSLVPERSRRATVERWILLSFFLASILLSFSRSFWVAGIVTLCVFFFIFISRSSLSLHSFLQSIALLGGVFLSAIFLINLFIYFPPIKSDGQSFASLLEERTTETDEVAVSSRWNLLPPLVEKIKEHWVLGSGFGTTVTYTSLDPRIVESTAKGHNQYTTYAFEWGYLDLWLKFGLVGLLIYCALIGYIGHRLTEGPSVQTGLFLGLVALVVTNIFSPYLNHPLGIGYVLILTMFVNTFSPSLSRRGMG